MPGLGFPVVFIIGKFQWPVSWKLRNECTHGFGREFLVTKAMRMQTMVNETPDEDYCSSLHQSTGGAYTYTWVLSHLSLELIFKAKLKLESGNQKIQYGNQAAILKVTSLKIYRLLPMATINMHMKFEIEIPKQTWLMLQKPCHLLSPETEISNMAARRPFWKWRCWKSIGPYPYT